MTTPPRDAAALAPCPFCGGEAKLLESRCAEDAMMAVVECSGCLAQTTVFEDAYAPTAEAIAAWNRRAPLPMSGDEWLEKAAKVCEEHRIAHSFGGPKDHDIRCMKSAELRDAIRALKTTPTHGGEG
jgi:Lar family restriction alleviation protein